MVNYNFVPKSKLSFAYHLVDHCNLNCKGCDNFSSIAPKKFIDITTFHNDLQRVKEIFGEKIDTIGLMGGEPFLNENICDFIIDAREIFPNAKIRIVTNGILLETLNLNFWETCYQNKIEIEYTKYPNTLNYNKIKETARKCKVIISVFGHASEAAKELQFVPFDMQGRQNIVNNFAKCFYANHCIQIQEGRVFTCNIRAYAEIFCKIFGVDMDLSVSDYMDLYDNSVDVDKILRFLATPIPFCRYCYVDKRNAGHIWRTSNKASIYDWIPFRLDERGLNTLNKYNKIILYKTTTSNDDTVNILKDELGNHRIIVINFDGAQNDTEKMNSIIVNPNEAYLLEMDLDHQLEIEKILVERGCRNLYFMDI